MLTFHTNVSKGLILQKKLIILCIFQIIDKFNEWFVSAFVTASQMRFIILHKQKNEEGIRQFFQEMYEIYIKHAMNPFYEQEQPIKSANFEQKAIMYARKYLNL